MFNKLAVLAGAMLALVGLSGCFEMESQISLKNDGSGTLTEKFAFGAQMVGMMAMGGEEDAFADFSEENLKKKAADYGEGVEFVSVVKEEKDGGITFTSTFKFTDIGKLIYQPGQMLNADKGAEGEEEQKPITFEFADKTLTINLPDPSGEDMGFGGEDMAEEQMAMMAPMMAGAKMGATIHFAEGVEESNALYLEGDTMTILSVNFDKLLQNEKGLAVTQELGVEGREEFAKAVKAIDGVEIESQEKITVKMK